MKTTRFGATIALGLAAGLALSACGSSGAQTGDSTSGAGPTQVSMLLDWAPNPDHAALYAAQHTGAYDDAGLSVSFATPSNTADAAREVSLGRVDLAISYEPDTLIAVESGLDVISVAALIPTSLTSLITRADSGITSAADLGGKTIGLSGLASQEPTIDFIARNAGVDPATISLPNVQQSLNQALLTDQVDAIFGAFRNIEGVELAAQGDFDLAVNGQFVRKMNPEKRNYHSSAMPMTEASIDAGLLRDVYVSLGEPIDRDKPEGEWAVRVYYKPFVDWIWGGCVLMSVGGLIAMLDRRYRVKARAAANLPAGTQEA